MFSGGVDGAPGWIPSWEDNLLAARLVEAFLAAGGEQCPFFGAAQSGLGAPNAMSDAGKVSRSSAGVVVAVDGVHWDACRHKADSPQPTALADMASQRRHRATLYAGLVDHDDSRCSISLRASSPARP